jgi:hypothetical protein
MAGSQPRGAICVTVPRNLQRKDVGNAAGLRSENMEKNGRVFDLINCEEIVCLFLRHNKARTFFAVYMSYGDSQQT